MQPKKTPLVTFCRWFMREIFFRFWGGIKAIGLEKIPLQGGVLLAPVHISHLDPPAVGCLVDRATAIMAKKELFRMPLLGWLIRALNSFPVRRGANDTEAIRRGIDVLKGGGVLLVFPEGTRGDGKHLGAISPGVAMLASRTECAVVPIGIHGTQLMLPKGRFFPKRAKVTVVFGEPFSYEDCKGGNSERENRLRFVNELKQRIVKSCAQAGMQLKIDDSVKSSESIDSHETTSEEPPPEVAEARPQP